MDTLFNDIVNQLVDERIEREKANTREEAKEHLNKLIEVIEKEKIPIVDTKQEQFKQMIKDEQKKTWSKLTKGEKEKIIDIYIEENSISNGVELKERIMKRKIKVKNIEYDRIKERIIAIKED